jgi:hypothetical protein
MAMQAPLEGIANLNVTPNPSKAPWYFVGLQELLVYFDPWIAGVMLPTLIIIGLMAIPYVDPNPKGVGGWPKMRWKRVGGLPIWYPTERPFAVNLFMLGVVMWFVLIAIGYYCRGPNWEWYWPWEEWSHRRITKMTLKNLPNLWGGLLLAAYFLQGTPIPKFVKERLAAKAARFSAAFHLGLGMAMSAALFIPLLHAPDPAYPAQSQWPTLLGSLGHAPNAPAMVALSQLIERAGPTVGFLLACGLLALLGVGLGLAGMQFARLKDRLYDELGPMKYAIVMGLLLMMMGVLGKIALRLLFGVKYLISFPIFSLNI